MVKEVAASLRLDGGSEESVSGGTVASPGRRQQGTHVLLPDRSQHVVLQRHRLPLQAGQQDMLPDPPC